MSSRRSPPAENDDDPKPQPQQAAVPATSSLMSSTTTAATSTRTTTTTTITTNATTSATTIAIQDAEAALRQAMLHSDVPALEQLLDPNLIFTNHLDQVVTKQDDLEAHRQGWIDIQTLETVVGGGGSDDDNNNNNIMIRVLPGERTAIVAVTVWIEGSFRGTPFADALRFTRVWQQTETTTTTTTPATTTTTMQQTSPSSVVGDDRDCHSTWKVVAAHSSLVAPAAPPKQGETEIYRERQ